MTATEPTTEEQEATRVSRDGVRALVKVTLPLWAALVIGCAGALGLVIWQQAQREHDRDMQRIAACRDRNSAQEAARADNQAIFSGLRAELPNALDTIERLGKGQSRPEDVDSDCDGDGWLTVDDYGIPKPAGLPIKFPPIREEVLS